LVKVESAADLDKDSGAIGTMEFLQKGKYFRFFAMITKKIFAFI
jgi:hypothetical protein